jgi:hypothetical protein
MWILLSFECPSYSCIESFDIFINLYDVMIIMDLCLDYLSFFGVSTL